MENAIRDVTQYNIRYVASCSGQTISNTTTVTDSTTNAMLSDLEEGLTYSISVTAVNVLGESDPAQIVQDTPPICNLSTIVWLFIFYYSSSEHSGT